MGEHLAGESETTITLDGLEHQPLSLGYKGRKLELKVKRIVSNIETQDILQAKRFYQEVLGLDLLMDFGWITTYGSNEKMSIQISFASQGGSSTPTPDLSIEVDDVDTAFEQMKKAGFSIEYGPANEPWGVRRFFVRDPFGKLVNILTHVTSVDSV